MSIPTATLDLSSVTAKLVAYLQQQLDTSPLWPPPPSSRPAVKVSGFMPQHDREEEGHYLNFYLFHVSPSQFVRNTPAARPGDPLTTNSSKELGLTLYYLLTAHSKDSVDMEQQIMGVAIKALHERSTFNGTAADPSPFSCTINMEVETPDEANRRWQAYTVAFRLSVVYRVSVVFLLPTVTPAPRHPSPHTLGISLAPIRRLGEGAALVGTASTYESVPAPAVPAEPFVFESVPAVAQPGATFLVLGNNLSADNTRKLFLIDAQGVELGEAEWTKTVVEPAGKSSLSRIDVTLPAFGFLPTKCPDPGIYQIYVASNAGARSNAVPLLIAPVIDGPPAMSGATYLIEGAGFQGELHLIVGAEQLARVGGSPTKGQFSVNNTFNQIRFLPGASASPGPNTVMLRVAGVETQVGAIDI